MKTVARKRPLVEILYFEGCPNYEAARELVDGVGTELGLRPELRLVEVEDEGSAQRLRFLGSSTIRVDGRDVEPNASERADYALACRVYRTDHGPSAQPEERWVRAALQNADRIRRWSGPGSRRASARSRSRESR